MKAIHPRALGLGLSLVCTLTLAAGCETLDQARRPRQTDPAVTPTSAEHGEVESTKILDVQADPAQPRPFFRSSRLPGGLSSEAREIESHMNIR